MATHALTPTVLAPTTAVARPRTVTRAPALAAAGSGFDNRSVKVIQLRAASVRPPSRVAHHRLLADSSQRWPEMLQVSAAEKRSSRSQTSGLPAHGILRS